jgi:hypothetical protein
MCIASQEPSRHYMSSPKSEFPTQWWFKKKIVYFHPTPPFSKKKVGVFEPPPPPFSKKKRANFSHPTLKISNLMYFTTFFLF